jgi:peptide/nickel transport system ATP-binding protein
MKNTVMLKVENLCTHFSLKGPHVFSPRQTVYAVNNVNFEIRSGMTFGLVGESGCGKSTTALSVLRLVEPTAGRIYFDGIDITGIHRKILRKYRRHMQIIFQDPYSSMNPRATAGDIVEVPLNIQKIGRPEKRSEKVSELFQKVGLRPEQKALYPHQFSGGQRQRICIARALASGARFIVCDEPVSALDVAIQAQILNLLIKLQQQFGLTYLFISHDVGVIQHMCDEIGVMYLGNIVEKADRRSLFKNVMHPYTQALLSAVPTTDLKASRSTERLKGDVPSPIHPPSGCHFHTRCPHTEPQCVATRPDLKEILPNHWVACHLVQEDGLKRK